MQRNDPPALLLTWCAGVGEVGKKQTSVIFAIVTYHEHDLPLEQVIVDETAGNAGEILDCLHVFELIPQCDMRR